MEIYRIVSSQHLFKVGALSFEKKPASRFWGHDPMFVLVAHIIWGHDPDFSQLVWTVYGGGLGGLWWPRLVIVGWGSD